MTAIPPIPVSVVILAKNEATNIRRCVEAVTWSDDIVVIDDHSSDNTVELAERAGARVVQHSFVNFAEQRNWGMTFGGLKHDWVLHLDADEVCTPELTAELRELFARDQPKHVAFKLSRKTIFDGAWLRYSDGFPVWIMRVVLRGSAEFEDCGHGEVAVPSVRGTVGVIRSPFLHFAFSKGISDWINRHNRYSTREAELEYNQQEPLRIRGLISSDRAKRRAALRLLSRQIPFRATLRFLYQFVFKLGFLDGRPGYTYCRLMATYESWIVLKRKEFEIQKHCEDSTGAPS